MKDNCRHHPLLQPLLPTTTTAAAQNSTSATILHQQVDDHDDSSIFFRFAFISIFGIICVWANREASKGHTITIVNEARGTRQGDRFDLFYGSNGKAYRMVYEASKFVENFLYPNSSYPKKQVNHVVLRLSSRPNMFKSPRGTEEEYVIHINSSVMNEEINQGRAINLAVQKGMASIWVWDGKGEAPASLVNGIVEYIVSSSVELPEKMVAYRPSDCCWTWSQDENNPKSVAEIFNYCEFERPGFIRRLNRELRSRWDDRATLDAALGMPSQHLCLMNNSSSIISSA